jgi:hypothetical protein
MRRRTQALVLGLAIIVVGTFFFVPLVYYNPMNKMGHASGYESLSCVLFKVGVSYGYPSFFANDSVFMLSCGIIHV